jgi:hypothetical protein
MEFVTRLRQPQPGWKRFHARRWRSFRGRVVIILRTSTCLVLVYDDRSLDRSRLRWFRDFQSGMYIVQRRSTVFSYCS